MICEQTRVREGGISVNIDRVPGTELSLTPQIPYLAVIKEEKPWQEKI